ncbi:MAG: M20/M25/M40 family metallo-hydrolase [Bacteroidales bacterium]
MKRSSWAAVALFFVCAHGSPTVDAQRVQAARLEADGAKAKVHLDYLASRAMKGRQSGTPEYRKAAEYVAARFKDFGLQPGGDQGGWFQEVPVANFRDFAQPVRLAITGPAPRAYLPGYGRDFQPLAGDGVARGRLAFAGYGVVLASGSTTATGPSGDGAALNWDDYAGIDVRGRIVMVLAGMPPGATREDAVAWTLTRKVAAARERGAVGLIEMDVSVPGQRLRTVQRATSGIGKDGCPPDFVVVRATANFCDDAFYSAGNSWRYHASQMLREKKPAPFAIDTAVEMEVHTRWEDRSAPNVIGVIPGSDPVLSKEYLLLGAHLDHEGVGVDGFVYPGADDDASGVATVLEVARVLHEHAFKPRRTLVLCAWMGEELGLVGSRWYTNHPAFPLERTALYLNMDMVGTGDSDLWVGGLDEFRELFDIVRAGLDPDLQKKLHPRLHYGGSDHTSFRTKGVPYLSLRSGGLLTPELDDEHPEYHRPGDDAQYIRPELLAQAADYHLQILTHLANMDGTLLQPRFFTRFIHRDATVVDMHCDTISRFMAGEDLSKDLATGHIDIPKLHEGGVDLQVFAAFIGAPQNAAEKASAARRAFDEIDAVHRLVAANPNDLSLVLGPSDLPGGEGPHKTGVLIGIEGGYAIENDLALLRSFYKSGVRLMTLTHWNRTDWADASGDEKAELGGLTEFGEQVVREMNRLGMIVDVSHVHDETFWDVLRVTTKPVVASHSCARGLSDHFRNLSDDMLKALAKNGGVVGINFSPGFLNSAIDRRQMEIIASVAKKYNLPASGLNWQAADPAVRAKAEAEVERGMADAASTLPVVDVKTVVDHIEHVIKVTGSADYVGLGSDFDGISATPRGLGNASKLVAITDELAARGHSEPEIRKILGGNFLRVFAAVTR